MKHFNWSFEILLCLCLIMFSSCRKDLVVQPIEIIPEPVQLDTLSGSPFAVDDHSIIYISDSSMYPSAEVLLSALNKDYDIEMVDSSLLNLSGISLIYTTDSAIHEQGYTLEIQHQRIIISARNPQGLWNGVQSLRQLLPSDPKEVDHSALPPLVIVDSPRFAWRGMHLDVSRHFMPVDFVKKYIDLLSYHKINMFHWHLVDDVGWRIEIKSHPELTEKGAWRVNKKDFKPWEEFELWEEGDPRPRYGGYYTQDEIREVVAFAASRGVTIVPEIEMPGHSEAVLECYPELRCIGEDGNLLPNNGVYCASHPSTFDLLENVLTEVMDLFPSVYIHIGGDEVNTSNWENCERDRAFMNRRNLSADQLQDHFINHFDQFLRDHDRKLLGWHDILSGNLSSTAAIMYWGGHEGVENTLKQGHQTVLTTGNRYYFDHYQSSSVHEPPAFGGLSTLTQVYRYDPLPPNLEVAYEDQVLGIQANAWTEYMSDPAHVEYMVFPRIAALAETAWSARDQKDWEKFKQKLPRLLDYYDHRDVNYAQSAYRPIIDVELAPDSSGLLVSLKPELTSELYYTVNGEKPSPQSGQLYQQPFLVTETTTVKAGAFKNDKELVAPEGKKVWVHDALGKEVELIAQPHSLYAANGGTTLTDGKFGGNNWGNGQWLGMLNKPVEIILHLNELTDIERIGFSSIEDKGAGIFFPDKIRASISENGQNFKEIGFEDLYNENIRYKSKTKDSIFFITFPPKSGSFLKVEALPMELTDQGVFTFTDELIVQ